MGISEIPSTPGMAYVALDGKRSDLLFTLQFGTITLGVVDAGPSQKSFIAIFSRAGRQPHFVFVGGAN